MRKISNIKELKLEILRRETLVGHQETVLKQDWEEMKSYAGKFSYAGRVFRFFTGGKNKDSSFFSNMFSSIIEKAKHADFIKFIPAFIRKIPWAFAKAGIPDIKEKLKNTWKQFSEFFKKD
jgi:hypothetical protein